MVEKARALLYLGVRSSSGVRSGSVYNADVRFRSSQRSLACRTLLSMRSTVTSLIASAEGGSPPAASALFTTLYADLRRLARYELSRGHAGATLTATALLHEAYLH